MHAAVSSPPGEFCAASIPLAEREAIVARFNQRVTAALLASPPTKELLRLALRRQGSPWCIVRMQPLSLDVILHYERLFAEVHRAGRDAIYHRCFARVRLVLPPPSATGRVDCPFPR